MTKKYVHYCVVNLYVYTKEKKKKILQTNKFIIESMNYEFSLGGTECSDMYFFKLPGFFSL